MKYFFVLSFVTVLNAFAQIPDPVVTTVSASGHFGIVAGRLNGKVESPVGISVQNGNITSSTITDAYGRWGIVIGVLSNVVSVHSFDLAKPLDRSVDVVHKIQ